MSYLAEIDSKTGATGVSPTGYKTETRIKLETACETVDALRLALAASQDELRAITEDRDFVTGERDALRAEVDALRARLAVAEKDRDAAIDREHETTERLLAADAALAEVREIHVLGHPATKEWCAAVDEHHAGTDQTCAALQEQLRVARVSSPGEIPGGVVNSPTAIHQLTQENAALREAEPQWIVNDLGELGVEVNGRCFFLYKGDNIEYTCEDNADCHPDGSPMLYRIVGKREFGETQWPKSWIEAGRRKDRYEVELTYYPGLSDGKPEDGAWKPLPSRKQAALHPATKEGNK